MNEVFEEFIDEFIDEAQFEFESIDFDDLLFKLKAELAMHHNNDYLGTEMGGSSSQLYYFMTHDVKKKRSPDLDVHVSQENNTLVLSLPPKVKLLAIRKAFNKFWETCPDKNEITQEQLSNLSFLRDLNSDSIEIHLLILGLEIARDLVSWLDREAEFSNQVSQFFFKEYKDTEKGFLSDMNLPADYFEKVNAKREQNRKKSPVYQEDKDPMREVLEKHPVWGKRWSAITDRQNLITDNLFSQEDLDKLNKIGSLPTHITLFVIRNVVTIDRMIKHNLDLKIKFFDEINKKLAPNKD